MYDLIVVGAGPAGIMCAISGAKDGKKVLILEKLPQIGQKLKSTGGGKCNLTNTCNSEIFMSGFGKNGRFMQDALFGFDNEETIKFFNTIGVETDIADGFRVFPKLRDSNVIVNALKKEMNRLHVEVICSSEVLSLHVEDSKVLGLTCKDSKLFISPFKG